jgi:hypothetical protein
VVADIIRTIVVSPTLSSALTLGLIVVVRIAFSFAIDVEVEGVAPWRKAETEAARLPRPHVRDRGALVRPGLVSSQAVTHVAMDGELGAT